MQLQTLAENVITWRRCLVLENPLVRASDRLQARVLLLVILMVLTAVPYAGAAGMVVYDGRVQTFAAQRLTRQEIPATATADSSPANAGYSKYHVTPVRWQVGTEAHTDQVQTPFSMKAGDSQSIWIDKRGNHVPAPLLDQDATTEAVAAAIGFWLIVAGACAFAWFRLRNRLDRSRYAQWDRALENLADNGGRTNHNA